VVPEQRDVEKTRVMVRIDPPEGAPGAPGSQKPDKKPSGDGRVAIWVGAGVLIGALLGALIVWFFITSSTSETGVLPVGTTTTGASTEASANTGATPSSTTGEARENSASSAKDTKKPPTPEVISPAASQYWLSPSNMKVEIKWEQVSDASGVSYVLEFSHWLGGGAGWTSPTRSSKIKRLYYNRDVQGPKERFRIIAIDGAGNESSPSSYRTLIEAPSASEAASLNAGY
jgi:hypothetical protein